MGVLEREKAELDDRVRALETQLAATDKLAAQDFATKVRGSRGGGEGCRVQGAGEGGSALGHTLCDVPLQRGGIFAVVAEMDLHVQRQQLVTLPCPASWSPKHTHTFTSS